MVAVELDGGPANGVRADIEAKPITHDRCLRPVLVILGVSFGAEGVERDWRRRREVLVASLAVLACGQR